MLTKNFYNYIYSVAMQKTFTGNTMPGNKTTMNYTNVSALSFYAPFECMFQHYVASSSAIGTILFGTHFGSGTTPATIDDCCLENVLNDSTLAVTYPSSTSFSELEDCHEYTATFGLTPKKDAVTISEVGLFFGDSSYGVFMADRTVLEEPITINPGETKQLTYTIRMNYPTA